MLNQTRLFYTLELLCVRNVKNFADSLGDEQLEVKTFLQNFYLYDDFETIGCLFIGSLPVMEKELTLANLFEFMDVFMIPHMRFTTSAILRFSQYSRVIDPGDTVNLDA